MAFQATTQRRIANILNLEREAYSPRSTLRALMDEVEIFDRSEGTTIVADIESLVAEIEAMGQTVDTAIANGDGSIRIIDEDSIYRVEFAEGASPEAGRAKVRATKVERLRSFVDPNRVLSGMTMGGLILW